MHRRVEVRQRLAEREDFRTGMVCAVVANTYRDSARKPEPYSPQDFMPSQEREQRRGLTREQWIAGLRTWGAFLGG